MPHKPHVVAGIIRNDHGEVVIACRRQGENSGLWEFPGGRVEEGEDHFTALIREIQEEFDSAVRPQKYLCEVPLSAGKHEYIMYAYTASAGEGDFMPADPEYAESRWVQTDALDSIDLAPADRLIARALITSVRNGNI